MALFGLTSCDMKRALVADDDPATRNVYSVILTENLPDLTVDVAANGLEAVDLFTDRHHGVLVLDLQMPVMDGLRTYHRVVELCKSKRWAMPAIVFCTAYAPPEPFKDIVTEGQPHCILDKPMTSDQLLAAVRERVSKS